MLYKKRRHRLSPLLVAPFASPPWFTSPCWCWGFTRVTRGSVHDSTSPTPVARSASSASIPPLFAESLFAASLLSISIPINRQRPLSFSLPALFNHQNEGKLRPIRSCRRHPCRCYSCSTGEQTQLRTRGLVSTQEVRIETTFILSFQRTH